MIIRIFVLILIFLTIGCSKPDPNPELRDTIYHDFLSQKSATEKDLADTLAKMNEYSAAAKKAAPQTGQFKQNLRKFYDMDRRAAKLRQQLAYWDVRIEERMVAARLSYGRAYSEKKPWPDINEVDAYNAEKRLRLARTQWDQKERIRLVKLNSAAAKPQSSGGKGP
jgi:hypothetical protein